MKWRHRLLLAACAATAVAARGELADYIQHLELADRLQGVFFHSATLPAGPVLARRAPAETRQALSLMITASPGEKKLYALRAREAELALDFAAAEADWKQQGDPLALADFYRRRLRPAEEIEALRAAGAFARAIETAAAHDLPADVAAGLYRAWIARAPGEASTYTRFFDHLAARKDWAAAGQVLTDYRKAFPADEAFPVRARAALERQRGGVQQALAVYDNAFRPLWPAELAKEHSTLLAETKSLGRYLERIRAAAAAAPLELEPAARLFYIHQQQGNPAAAGRALADYRRRKEAARAAWSAGDLLALGRLFEAVQDYDEAARAYYALYERSPEEGLVSLAHLLLSAPEHPIRFGAGDLTFYRDIATLDRGPGFLNGVLSLILNSTGPEWEFEDGERRAAAYFHRARAAELVALMDARYPNTPRRAALHAKLIDAYAAYGESGAVIAAGRRFLDGFAEAPERVTVTLAMAGAHARLKQEKEEFAAYESLLAELGKRAGGTPLGEKTPRSPDYARVLDRYIARLAAGKRIKEALALYRRQIDLNPGDAGLYERLAAFLEQNKLAAEVEQVYRRAMAQFADRSWHHKLARWYLRRKQTVEFTVLARDVCKVFSGAELETYFREIVDPASLDAALYRQVNLYAQQRFPHNLTFVKNLLLAYARRGTADPAAWERLLRNYWFYEEELRARFFEFLSRTGRLETELQAALALPASATTARFMAEAEVWRCRYESAAPRLRALAEACPGCREEAGRAAALERSLGNLEAAGAIQQRLHEFDPRDTGTMARLGEIRADVGDFARARPWWNRIAEIEPGRAEGYLEAATVFWDYFLYDDALRLLRQGRERLGNPALYAYEAGAIYENQRDYARAIEEYVRGAQAQEGGSRESARLIALARRPELRSRIEAATAKTDPAAIGLRVALLEAQGRRADLERYLSGLADSAATLELAARIRDIAGRQGFTAVERRALMRETVLAPDATERIRARLALTRFEEANGMSGPARQGMEALLRDHPLSRGVIRAGVDFCWRTGDRRRAVEILERSARAAYPELARQYTLEAARKAAEAGDYSKARDLAEALLKVEPLHPEYVAAMADVFARRNDDAGLRDFYSAKIQAQRDPAQAAALRRSLIPVLTRIKAHTEALAQYIELLNRAPEDEVLAREAAAYATQHGGRAQVLDRYSRAAAESPRDARWPLILARLETHFENLPAAVAAYEKAVALRPERTDLLEARARAEERLLRFDSAAQAYAKLYELTYRNPHWMTKAAEMRAREGRKAEAVAALRQAYLDGRPARADAFFAAAQMLESWSMLAEARPLVEKGAELCSPEELAGASVYARVMGRLRQYEEVFRRGAALQDLAAVVRAEYTPEETSAFAAFLDSQKTPERLGLLIDLAETAGLAGREASWLHERAMATAGQPEAETDLSRLNALQAKRGRFDELGAQLEAYWKAAPLKEGRDLILNSAAEAYRWAGDTQGELRVLGRAGILTPESRERYFSLLKTHDPQRLAGLAARNEEAANWAVAAGDAGLALRAVEARGSKRAPAWQSAYRALTGLYYARLAPEIRAAFTETLGGGTVGESLGRAVDRRRQLAGDIWFYYGARYGEYLALDGQAEAEDYLPAALEAAPGRAEAYETLAGFYREKGDTARALADYQRALELDAHRAGAHIRMAELAANPLEHWRAALAALNAQMDQRRPPAAFWEDAPAAIASIARRSSLAPLRGEIDRLMRTYLRRNGAYRAESLLEAVTAAGGMEWTLELAGAAADPVPVLESLAEAPWLSEAQREAVLRRLAAAAGARAARALGESRPSAQWAHRRWQVRLIEHRMSMRRHEEARQALAAIPPEERRLMLNLLTPLEVRLAARTNTLEALLEGFRSRPETAPDEEALRYLAADLRRDGDRQPAAALLNFIYSRWLEAGQFNSGNFLGLAEAQLELGEPAAAAAALRRMRILAEDPFESLGAAAELLARHGRQQEAAEFRDLARKASPWWRAVQVAPDPLLARLRAALDAGDAVRAAAAIQPAWQEGEMTAERFLAGYNMTQAGRAALALRLGEAHEKVERLSQARSCYDLAREISPSAEARAALERLRAAEALREENQRRRPVVRDLLDQPHLVRPRKAGP